MENKIESFIMEDESRVQKTIKTGISFGSALAMVISFVTWKSVFWAIIHGLMGWIYVIYYILFVSNHSDFYK